MVPIGFGYSSEDDFKQDEKVLRHYTGLSSYTVLMAVFQLVSAVLPEGGAAKLTKFEYFTLTLMKLRLTQATMILHSDLVLASQLYVEYLQSG